MKRVLMVAVFLLATVSYAQDGFNPHTGSDTPRPTRPPAEPEPTDEELKNYYSVGCRLSAGECYNSCSDHRYLAFKSEDRCKDDVQGKGDIACYCKIR